MRRKIPESTLPKIIRTQMITPEGMEKLREEHDHLWRVERPDVTAKVSWAASLGDRSENADYHYNKNVFERLIVEFAICVTVLTT